MISTPEKLHNAATQFLIAAESRRLVGEHPILRQTDADLIAKIPAVDRIRFAAPDRVPYDIKTCPESLKV
jgi:RHH-type proline utilization regulon transcriptional repressor/proline dehydrogenase/delta 1-pyrroline-5-carboxylate dehydrogenase